MLDYSNTKRFLYSNYFLLPNMFYAKEHSETAHFQNLELKQHVSETF